MTREPDFQGRAGRAWQYKGPQHTPDQGAAINGWLVNIPNAHPFWKHWCVNVCHLRDLPGVKPAAKHYPEAEYEFSIYSVNPTKHPIPTIEEMENDGLGFLLPMDVVFQFHGVSDDVAREICKLSVRAIVDGMLSPDQDYRRAWENALKATVEHFKSGVHAVQ